MNDIQVLENEIRNAKSKAAGRLDILPRIDASLDTFPQLERNLALAEKQRYNGVLFQLATIGQQLNIQGRSRPALTLHRRLIKVSLFLADAFPDDLSPIWYLQGINPETIFKHKKADLDQLIERLKISEWDLSDTFEEWLNGTQEYLDGMQDSGTNLLL